jgi:hypothetical protein
MSTEAGRYLAALVAAFLVGGCVTAPTYPTIAALPGKYKPYSEYLRDDAACREFAASGIRTVDGYSAAASDRAAEAAVAGTVLGAATGALLGAASHDAGAGAAVGAGLGLLFGSLAGTDAAAYTGYHEQQRFDGLYLQCMYARGNQVPGRPVYRAAPSAPRSVPPGYVPAPAAAEPPPGYILAPPPRG